jgi:4-methylaminobutanoate oxidase (formaldehyde-forming)
MTHSRSAAFVDTLVIGGGVIGCSIAYHLVRLGIQPVLVLERNALASGATSRAAALLTHLRAKIHHIPLVMRTYAAIRELQGEIEDSPTLSRVGSLHVAASPESHDELLRFGWIAESHNLAFLWIDPAEIARCVPWFDGSAALGIAFMPEDAVIDPYLLTQGYARAARSRGATIRTGVAVTELLVRHGIVRGVRTSEGEVRARRVVDAGGAWGGLLARHAGVQLPMAPVRSHYWITSPEAGFPHDMPYVVLPDARAYVRAELGGLIIGMREPASLSVDPLSIPADIAGISFGDDADGWTILTEGREKLQRFYPGMDEARFTRFVTGLSTYTPDGDFVLGAVSDLEGYLVATGCCGAGIAASGGIGLAIAELAGGLPPSFDLEAFRVERFGKVDATSEEFRARCAAARSAKVSG